MKPHKHPLLFSVLALTLACLLLNASIIQVSGVAPIVIILSLVGAAIGGGITGWFVHDWLSKQSESPGVDLDSYMFSVMDRWDTDINNAANYVKSISVSLTWAKEYYGRVASYKAGEYLDKESLDPYEEDLMRDIAYDLYSYYYNTTIRGLDNFIDELARFADERLTGNLEEYSIYLVNSDLRDAIDTLPVYKYTGSFKAWIFGDVKVAVIGQDTNSGGTFVFRNLKTNQTFSVDAVRQDFTTVNIPEGIYEVTYSPWFSGPKGLIAMENILVIADSNNLVVGFAGVFDAISFTYVEFGTYLEVRKSGSILKYIDLTDVEYAVKDVINQLDMIYDAAFNSARMVHENCRNAGFTDPSQADQCPFIYIPPTVAFPTIKELYERFGQNYDEMLAHYLALLQKLNETMQNLEEDFSGMISELNLSFADVREHFENVLLQIGNQTLEIQKLIPLWITQAQEFYANASNTLQGMMGALAIFKNGTVRYIVIPPGSTLTPQIISTPNGLVPSLDLQNWVGGLNPAYTPGNYTEPTFVTPASETVQVTLQLLFAVLPLILLLAVVNMITNLGRRR